MLDWDFGASVDAAFVEANEAYVADYMARLFLEIYPTDARAHEDATSFIEILRLGRVPDPEVSARSQLPSS